VEIFKTIQSYIGSPEFLAAAGSFLLNLMIALAIFIVGRWIAKAVSGMIKRLMKRHEVDPTLVNFLGNLIYAALLAVVILAAVGRLGIETTSMLAIFGAAGLAVGLALKDSLSNFAAGVMLILFRPFKQGDFVEVGGVSGTVAAIRIFSTQLNTGDNKAVTIPNGNIVNGTITNYTANDTRRIDMIIGVGYDDDLKKARQVIDQVCANHALILKDPATKIFVLDLAESSVNFAVRPWVNTDDYWGVRSDVLEQCKAGLEAAGCTIPYPQRDIHLHKSGD
jgi:small conductance mechanosensitive channel